MWRTPHIWAFFRHSHSILCVARAVGNLMDGKATTSSTISATASSPLPNLLVTFNLLAFAFHTVATLSVLAWRNAIAARGTKRDFFQHLRTVTAYIIFADWQVLLLAITDPKARSP